MRRREINKEEREREIKEEETRFGGCWRSVSPLV